MSRPWATDPYLKRVMHEFVEKHKSITKLITYSQNIKEIYGNNRAQCKEEVKISKAVRDFAFAPQRYDSEAKVLLRLTLTFDAAMTTACQVICLRGASSDEGKACADLLDFMSDEAALQLAMMADCSREIHRIVEMCDRSDFDEAGLPALLDECQCILEHLFKKGQCLHVPGMTGVMVQTLRRPRTYLVKGVPKTVGSVDGVSEEVKMRCLRRMAAWTTLAHVVLQSEFPDWDLLSSFQVFSLSKSRTTSTTAADGSRKVFLDRLAASIGICPIELYEQFNHFEPIAAKNMQRMKCTNFEAWRDAVLARRSTNILRAKYPSDALLRALARYGTWTASSSDVERGFAQSSRLKGGSSEDLHVDKEELLMVLRSDKLEGDALQKLLAGAAKLWFRSYGRVRQAPKRERIHVGLPQPKRRREGEASYLRDRDSIVTSLTGEVGRVLPTTCVGDVDLTEKQRAEVAFNNEKVKKSQVEALLSGYLAASEVSVDLMEAATKHMDNLTKNQHERNLEKKRQVKKLQKGVSSIEGAVVFFEAGCDTFTLDQLRMRSVVRCNNRWEADLFIVKEPATASLKIQIVARITGARIATPEYLEARGERGACIAFEPAMATKRNIYLTPDFMELHLHVASDIHKVLQLVDCKWTLVGGLADVNKILGNGAGRQGKQRLVLVFATQAETLSED